MFTLKVKVIGQSCQIEIYSNGGYLFTEVKALLVLDLYFALCLYIHVYVRCTNWPSLLYCITRVLLHIIHYMIFMLQHVFQGETKYSLSMTWAGKNNDGVSVKLNTAVKWQSFLVWNYKLLTLSAQYFTELFKAFEWLVKIIIKVKKTIRLLMLCWKIQNKLV